MHGSDITKLYSKFDFLVTIVFLVIQAWIKRNYPLKLMKNRVNRRVEMTFISMIGKTVRDNTSDHLWIYFGSYYVLLDGLAYHKQLYFSASITFLINHHAPGTLTLVNPVNNILMVTRTDLGAPLWSVRDRGRRFTMGYDYFLCIFGRPTVKNHREGFAPRFRGLR